MFMVLSSWPKSLQDFTRFIWWMQTERRVAANPQTKPVDLGCESAENAYVVVVVQLVSTVVQQLTRGPIYKVSYDNLTIILR